VATGVNSNTLTLAQMPNHGHTTTVVINDPGHTHTIQGIVKPGNHNGNNGAEETKTDIQTTSTSFTGLRGTVDGVNQNVFVNVANTGGGSPHPNVQPGVGAYFIMFIP
jgi:microcystin-dependent protein